MVFGRFLSPGWSDSFLVFCIFSGILRHKFRVPTWGTLRKFYFWPIKGPWPFWGALSKVVFDVSGSGVIILQLELAKEPYAIAGILIIQLLRISGHPNVFTTSQNQKFDWLLCSIWPAPHQYTVLFPSVPNYPLLAPEEVIVLGMISGQTFVMRTQENRIFM